MKNILLFTSLICLTINGWAQKNIALPSILNDYELDCNDKSNLNNVKGLGQVLWSDDFDDTTLWVIDNDGQSGVDFGWNINSTSEGWWSTGGITSTSGGNYAELVNGNPTVNPATQQLGVIYTLTTANPIDLTALGGSNMAILEFEQYGARFNDLQEVQISFDNITYVTIDDNLDQPVLSSSGGSAYANPMTKSVNLSGVLGANPQPFYLRFSWTTNFPGSASNPNVWVTYGWYLDDIKITSMPDNDLNLASDSWGSVGGWGPVMPYYQVANSQITDIEFTADVVNEGMNNQSNVTLDIDINSGQTTTQAVVASVVPLDTAFLVATPSFVPSATGVYNATRTISSDSTDDVPTNNVLDDISFEVTDYIYARDNGTPDGFNGPNANSSEFETGNVFDIFADGDVGAIDVRFHSSAEVGAEYIVKLWVYDVVGGDFVYASESDYQNIESSDLGSVKTIPFLFGTPYPVVAGDMCYATVHASAGATGNGVVISEAGTSAAQTSFVTYEGDWASGQTNYYTTSTPMVRLNFQDYTSINEIENNFDLSVYPNPTSDEANISFTAENEDVTIVITDLAGKEVYTTTSKSSAGVRDITVNTANFNSGVYVIKLTSNNAIAIKNLIVK